MNAIATAPACTGTSGQLWKEEKGRKGRGFLIEEFDTDAVTGVDDFSTALSFEELEGLHDDALVDAVELLALGVLAVLDLPDGEYCVGLATVLDPLEDAGGPVVDVLEVDGARLLLACHPLCVAVLRKVVDEGRCALGGEAPVDGLVVEEGSVQRILDVQLKDVVELAVLQDEVSPQLALFLSRVQHGLYAAPPPPPKTKTKQEKKPVSTHPPHSRNG